MDKNIVLQNGATIYATDKDGVSIAYVADKDGVSIAYDMNVPAGVKEMEICMNLSMGHTKKCFPDVEKLIIGDDVSLIDIPNSLFPNVRSVDSTRSLYFMSGPYLIREHALKNTFYRDENDVIDLKDVFTICKYAFQGCKSLKVINTACLGSWRDIDKDAFTDSALMKQPFINGVKMAGNIVIDVDETADEVVIPDGCEDFVIFSCNVSLSGIKKMVVHNERTLDKVCYDGGVPQNVTLKTNEYVIPGDILDLVHKSLGSSYVHRFSIESTDYKEVDGMIFTSDMKSLVAGSLDLDDVTIPEGVININYGAFYRSHLKSVKLPDSLEKVERSAFEGCLELKSVKFGNGLTEIGAEMFRGCKNLKSVILPPQIKIIKKHAFINSGLESVILNNGLEQIEEYVFNGTNIKSLYLPESIKDLGYWFTNDTIEVIDSPVFHASVVDSISSMYRGTDNFTKLKCAEKYAYIPKYVKPCMYQEMILRAVAFFSDPTTEFCTFWDCAYSVKGKEDLAFLEYEQFGDESAKAYIKKNSKRFVKRLIEEGDEEKTVNFLKTGFVSKITLKTLLPIAKEKEQMTVQSYILEQMNAKGIAKDNFYL